MLTIVKDGYSQGLDPYDGFGPWELGPHVGYS